MTTPETAISFPRQEAVTRRFRLGLPRGFQISPDGSRLAFIRSAGGRDPIGSLWVAHLEEGELAERCVVDARALVREDADLPEAEKSRRERLREMTSGITAFSADDELAHAVFSLDGELFAVDLVSPDARAMPLPTPGSVVDPRIAPDGRTAAFVSDRSVHVVAVDGGSPARTVAAADTSTVAWGLADFIAAEELDRDRGLWWLSGSQALLAERIDEADVPIRWIADPAQPEREPVAHRYPAAGASNPEARLFRIALDGSAPAEVRWDHDAYPYLATVQTDAEGGALVGVLSRDQQRMLILGLSADGAVTVVRERMTAPWVTIHAGVPRRAPSGALVEVVADTAADTFRLTVDDVALTPPGLNVCDVLSADVHGIVVTAQSGPMDQGVYSVGYDGTLTAIADEPGVHFAVVGIAGSVVSSTTPDQLGSSYEARLVGGHAQITSLAEVPVVRPVVSFTRVTVRDLACAVLFPTGHVAGSASLPVVMAPYGGPHHARVVHAASAFASDQWLADQGFAVVVVDGAGTPGRGPLFEYEVHGDLASGVLDDQVAALRAVARLHPDLDLDRVGITGWSFGGYLAALAVLDRPDVFHVAVAGAPVTDWRLYDTAYSERYLGLPQDNQAAYDASSLLTRAAGLTRPLLIIHGLADDNVLAANTLQLSSALLAAGREHSVLPLSGVTHFTPQEEVAENLLRLEVDFLRRHLSG